MHRGILQAIAAGPRDLAVTFVQISIALTPPLYGLVADWTGSYRSVWALLCCLLLLALVPAMLIRERDEPELAVT